MIPLDRLIILIRTQHCSTTTDLVLVASAYNGGRWSMMRILREDFGIDHTQTHVPFLQNKNPKNKIGNKFSLSYHIPIKRETQMAKFFRQKRAPPPTAMPCYLSNGLFVQIRHLMCLLITLFSIECFWAPTHHMI